MKHKTVHTSIPRVESEHTVRFSSLSTPTLVGTLVLLFAPAIVYSMVFSVELWSVQAQKIMTACAACLFLSHFGPKYYEENIVENVKITCKKNAENIAILKVIESSLSQYRPTFWGLSGHTQSVMFAYWPLSIVFNVGKDSALQFERETLTMSDGGIVQLDWANHDGYELVSEEFGSNSTPLGADLNWVKEAPILLILPGVVGKSANAYVHRLGVVARKAGYRVCVKGYRGIDAPMTAFLPETWGPRSLDDLHEVLEIIQSRHPNVPIVGAGFSFGGLCLQSYAGSPANHKSKLLKAAVSFSGCFDPEFIYTEGVLRHRLMPYDLGLSLSVVNDMKPHFELMGKHLGTDLGKVLIGSRSMEAYHNAITIQAMGISSTVEYWLMMGQFHRQLMRSINVPVLSLLADDDPLIPPKVSAGAVESITQSDGAILVQTKRGGHAGFFEYSTGECYADRVALDFLNACCRRCVV